MNKTEFLEQLLEDNKNDWMGGSDLDELLASKVLTDLYFGV